MKTSLLVVDILVLLFLSIYVLRCWRLGMASTLLALARWAAILVCLVAAVATYKLWGIIAVIVGLLLGGVGIFPMALVASAVEGRWAGFLALLAAGGFVTLIRWLGYKAVDSALLKEILHPE